MRPREDRRRPVVFPEPDAVIEEYKKHLDRTLLRENLKLTIPERCSKFLRNMAMVYELRRAIRSPRKGSSDS